MSTYPLFMIIPFSLRGWAAGTLRRGVQPITALGFGNVRRDLDSRALEYLPKAPKPAAGGGQAPFLTNKVTLPNNLNEYY